MQRGSAASRAGGVGPAFPTGLRAGEVFSIAFGRACFYALLVSSRSSSSPLKREALISTGAFFLRELFPARRGGLLIANGSIMPFNNSLSLLTRVIRRAQKFSSAAPAHRSPAFAFASRFQLILENISVYVCIYR